MNASLNNAGAKIGSENDLKAVKWSVHLHNEEKYVRKEPFVTVIQRRVEQFLLRVHSEAIKISLHKTCMAFAQRKVV